MGNFLAKRSVQLGYALVGTLVGLSVFGSFFFVIGNQAAGVLGLLSGIYALWVALCIWRRHKTLPDGRQAPISDRRVVFVLYMVFASGGLVLGLLSLIFYLVYAGMKHEPVTGKSSWVTAVWGFMLAKWSLGLLVHTVRFHRDSEVDGYEPVRADDFASFSSVNA